MKRWFYRDPLAAAWMAKHFGMMFVDLDQLEVFPLQWTSPLLHGVKMFVHKTSLHLLEPRPGDLMTNIGVIAWRLASVDGERLLFLNDYVGRRDEMTVIQRDGLAFHWPETEAA